MKKHLASFTALIFFIMLMAIGASLYRDFGVPFDDPAQMELAAWNYRYVFKGDPTLLTYTDRYHGTTFELPLLWIQTRFGKPNYNAEYVRHLILYFLFLAGLIIFYLLSRRLFHSSWWGLLSVVFLAASPRIYMDAFYNSKDIPFMMSFIAAIGTLMLFLDTWKKQGGAGITWVVLGVHALASGWLIATRVPGIAIVPISLILLLAVEWGSHQTWKHGLATIFLYLILSAGFTVLFFPDLWHNPLGEFINAFKQMSRYLPYDKAVLYLGNYWPSDALPWHYLPVWIGISTPLVILAGILPGFLDWARSAGKLLQEEIRKRWSSFAAIVSDPDTLGWLAVIGWLVIPVIAIYWFHSVLYQGYRQMFFIYPPLVLLSTRGFYSVYQWFTRKTGRSTRVLLVTLLILAVGLAEPVDFMIQYSPCAYVYFNSLAGDPTTLWKRFELDYWGLSYKPAMDYILAHDPRNTIRIFAADTSGLQYYDTALAPQPKSRVVMVKSQNDPFDYFIGDFLTHPYDYYPSKYEYYSISLRGTKIIVVYRFH